MLKERVKPYTLQQELAQIILFDMDSPFAFPYFEEWTGDPSGFGPVLQLQHGPEEIEAGLVAIGYDPKRKVYRVYTDPQKEGLGPESFPNLLIGFNRNYTAFWKRRGLPPKIVSRKVIDPDFYYLSWRGIHD